MSTWDEKSVLRINNSTLKQPKVYKINIEAIESIEDLKEILKGLNLYFIDTHWLNNIPDKYKVEVKE